MKAAEERIERLAYRYAEAAEAIGCCPEHIANLVKRGELRSAQVGRCRVIPVDELRRLLARTSSES